MHGNVWEWCGDHWHDSYEGAPSDGSPWEERGDATSSRVIRGGSWIDSAESCRCSVRFRDDPDYRGINLGFRVVLVPSSRAQAGERSEPIP